MIEKAQVADAYYALNSTCIDNAKSRKWKHFYSTSTSKRTKLGTISWKWWFLCVPPTPGTAVTVHLRKLYSNKSAAILVLGHWSFFASIKKKGKMRFFHFSDWENWCFYNTNTILKFLPRIFVFEAITILYFIACWGNGRNRKHPCITWKHRKNVQHS